MADRWRLARHRFVTGILKIFNNGFRNGDFRLNLGVERVFSPNEFVWHDSTRLTELNQKSRHFRSFFVKLQHHSSGTVQPRKHTYEGKWCDMKDIPKLKHNLLVLESQSQLNWKSASWFRNAYETRQESPCPASLHGNTGKSFPPPSKRDERNDRRFDVVLSFAWCRLRSIFYPMSRIKLKIICYFLIHI